MRRHLIPTFTRPQAISSVYGKIDQILLSFPGGQDQVKAYMVIRRYKEFFQAFGDRVAFTIMGNFGEQKEEISAQLYAENLFPELIDTPMAKSSHGRDHEHKHGEFIEDTFVMMESIHGEPLLLEQYRNFKHKNAFIADQYADAMGIPILPTRFALEGGNVLIGDDYGFIGRNLLERNRALFYKDLNPKDAEQKLVEAFRSLLGLKYVYFIGGDTVLPYAKQRYPEHPEALQPFFHLDLYLTLGGKNKRGDEIILLAEIDHSAVSESLTEPQRQILQELNTALKAVKEQLEAISASPFGPRFEIEEIPMGGSFQLRDGKDQFIPFSYNNAQVEWYHGISRIYLPQYPSCNKLEDRLRENLPGLGFNKLCFVNYEFEAYAEQNGSLHCLTKVMRRTSY